MPPAIAMASEKITMIGSIRVAATTRGRTSTRTGLTPIARIASICSVTFMLPSSAAMAAPTRPPTTSAVSTGPSSITVDLRITAPRYRSGTTLENW